MHIFYNETFDFRIVVNVDDFHQACEILCTYLNGKKYSVHELSINDFIHESVDVVLQ